MAKTNTAKLWGFVIAMTIAVAGALAWAWLMPSAILSFLNWEWASITRTYWGRAVFILFAVWEVRTVLKKGAITYKKHFGDSLP